MNDSQNIKIENNDIEKKGNLNKKRILITVIVVLITMSAIAGCYFYINNVVNSYENFVYPGVFIGGSDYSKFTKEELADELKKNYVDTINKKIINVKANDKNYTLNFSSLHPKYNVDEVVQKAFNYKKDESLINKFLLINNLANNNEKHNIDLKYEYDDDAIIKLVNNIETDVFKEPVDASMKIEDGNIIVTDDIKGTALKKDELISALNTIASNFKEESYDIEAPLKEEIANITGDSLRKINGIISTFTTYDSSYVRLVNMDVAANDLNGTLVMPGKTFSFNDTVGDSLPEKGYVLSHSFINGRSVEDYGGGVCQVSTTLYGTMMRANIKPTERGPHSMPIWYVPKGLDAAVFYGSMDLKFINEYSAPIYIYAHLSGEYLTITFYGNTNLMNGLTYEPYSVQVASWEPGPPNYIDDSSKPKGYIKVEQSPTNGYRVDVYMQTLDSSGNVIKDEYMYSDVYDANPGYVIRGIKSEPKNVEPKDVEPKDVEHKD